MKAGVSRTTEPSALPAAPRPQALIVGPAAERLCGPGVAAALDARPASLAEAEQALAFDAVDAIVVDGELPSSALNRFLEEAGATLRPGRPVLIVVAREGQRTLVASELAENVDDFVNGARGERGLLARLHNALRARAAVDELQRRNEELRRAQDETQALAHRMSEELRLAAHLQRSLLPPPLQHPGLDVAREYLPAREIGGDYFDLVALGGERFALALGDVMGKGVPAALLASTLKAGLRAQLVQGDLAPGELVGRLNRLFWEVTPKGLFASLFFGVLDLGNGRLDFVNAGHDHPFVVREDAIEDLTAGGTVLGLVEASEYAVGQVALAGGDTLVLYSDGVTDRNRSHEELFGIERLKAAAFRSRHDPARIALYSILGEVQVWAGATPPHDDMTLVVARLG